MLDLFFSFFFYSAFLSLCIDSLDFPRHKVNKFRLIGGHPERTSESRGRGGRPKVDKVKVLM